MTRITLGHGSGGEESRDLIGGLIYKYLGNEILAKNEDAAILNAEGKIAYSTDSFTVSPLFFNGGDIGKLAVCGTCNDLAMMGAKPLYLSLGLIIEEGFLVDDLEKILASMQRELAVNSAKVVCGDTKVVPKGSADGLYINTSGIGQVLYEGVSSRCIGEGDVVLVSGTIGDHGATIFASREGINIRGDLQSDCASLFPLVQKLIDANIGIKALRDATRGGLAAVLNEWRESSNIGFLIEEKALPYRDATLGLCELLGFELYNLANEGMFAVALNQEDAEKALSILHQNGALNATIIGVAQVMESPRVELKSPYGTKRLLEYPSGELLPRIC